MGLKRYWNRIKKYIHGNSVLGDSFWEGIVVDALLKFFLHCLAKIGNALMEPLLENYEWRRRKLNKQRKLLLERWNQASAKYHDALKTILNCGTLIADVDQPYFMIWQETVHTIQCDFEEMENVDRVISQLKEGEEPKAPEKFWDAIDQLAEKRKLPGDGETEELKVAD